MKEKYIAAYRALKAASEALKELVPNGRDYSVDEGEELEIDRADHFERLATINTMMNELNLEASSRKRL